MRKTLLALLVALLSVASSAAQSGIWGVDTSTVPERTTESAPGSTTSAPSTLATSHVRPSPLPQPRMFFGGGLSLGFGDVEYYDIQPMIGVHLTPQLSTGVSLLYRYREDTRFTPSLSTEDYGGTVFARYHLVPTVFIQGEYEYLDYEYVRADLSKDRDVFTSFLAGAGITQPLGRNSTIYASALYNFSYDDSNSPYDSPWVYRVGVGFGF